MKIFISIFILCTIGCSAFSQSRNENKYTEFIADYTKALNSNFTETDLNKMFRKYDELLTPSSDVTRLRETLEGHHRSVYPLYDFKVTARYVNHINSLLSSKNPNHRILAYLVIAASGDTSKINALLKKIKTEHKKGNLLWAGMGLLYLRCDQTTPLFDFLVKNENFGDAHMLPMYVTLNKDSLQQTAYSRINSSNVKAKILAAQILSVTPVNKKTEDLLMQAVRTWDINIKGYAIYSIKELQIGNLLDTFKPLVDSPQTHRIALEAVANSPTSSDRQYLFTLVDKEKDTIPNDLLNCFYQSKSIENIKYWLATLSNKLVSKNYVFFVYDQPLLVKDDILQPLQQALRDIKEPKILGELVRALNGRTDDQSIDIMISFLDHKNTEVRYWTAKTLENNLSPRIKNPQMQEKINKGLKDE